MESNIFGLDVYYSVPRRAILEQTRSSLCLLMSEGHHSFSQTNQNQNGGFVYAWCGFCLHQNGLETNVFFCYWLACWRLSHLVFELFHFELGISLLFIGCSLNILNNLGLFWFWIIMGCVGVTWLSRPSDSRRVRARSWLPLPYNTVKHINVHHRQDMEISIPPH